MKNKLMIHHFNHLILIKVKVFKEMMRKSSRIMRTNKM